MIWWDTCLIDFNQIWKLRLGFYLVFCFHSVSCDAMLFYGTVWYANKSAHFITINVNHRQSTGEIREMRLEEEEKEEEEEEEIVRQVWCSQHRDTTLLFISYFLLSILSANIVHQSLNLNFTFFFSILHFAIIFQNPTCPWPSTRVTGQVRPHILFYIIIIIIIIVILFSSLLTLHF